MDANDIQHVNLVQSIWMRPLMYTQNGTLAEVYDLLANDDSPQPIYGNRDDPSVCATLEWLRAKVHDPNNVVDELLTQYRTDAEALDAMCRYASDLPAG